LSAPPFYFGQTRASHYREGWQVGLARRDKAGEGFTVGVIGDPSHRLLRRVLVQDLPANGSTPVHLGLRQPVGLTCRRMFAAARPGAARDPLPGKLQKPGQKGPSGREA
jgi:hypothetical protein